MLFRSQAQAEEAQRAHEKEMANMQRQAAEEAHEREKDLIITKEEERRETEIQKQTILSMGFNENKDVDNDGVPDVLEVARHNVDADIKARKLDLEEKKFEQSKKEHADKQKLEKQKLSSKPKKS